jgi:SpoVK/Ycf46/Vps4 family AAA+-type ATPase
MKKTDHMLFIWKMDRKRIIQKMDTELNKQYIQSGTHGNKYDYYDEIFKDDVFNPYTMEPLKKQYCEINVKIENLNDLINLIEDNPICENIEYNINMKQLHKIHKPLKKLRDMIGMNELKNEIIDQILYFIQGLQSREGDFMHTCIYGPPGTGKTEISKIMGEIYSKLGILSKGTFTKVTRSDLIAAYLGQTALKTKKVIEDNLGGVLFIDEAYALGNPEKRDSFAKECIDTLCEALSNHKKDLMVIIAGYEKDLNKSFFSYNQGLDSRFTWRFKTDDYQPKELREIFFKKVKDIQWECEKSEINIKWFEKNKDYFTFYGRDMETLLAKTKIVHSRRVFCLPDREKKKITMEDLMKGFQKFISNEEVKKRVDDDEKYLREYLKHTLYS